MNKKIFMTVLTLTAILLVTPYIGNVHAKPPKAVSGTASVDIFSPLLKLRQAGLSDNQILTILLTEYWQGNIEGTGTGISVWVSHGFPFLGWTLNIHEKLTFTDAKVFGQSGTFTMELAFQESETESKGLWTILRGTDGLENLHGQGTIDLSTFPYTYSGQVHFDP